MRRIRTLALFVFVAAAFAPIALFAAPAYRLVVNPAVKNHERELTVAV
jgi:hypothetical protein